MKWHVPPSGLKHSQSCRPVAHATGKDMPPAGLVPVTPAGLVPVTASRLKKNRNTNKLQRGHGWAEGPGQVLWLLS